MAEQADGGRSRAWFGATGKDGIIYRSWLKSSGYPHDAFDGRPVIGICNSASDLTPCNVHLTRVSEAVKRGVWAAGGFPLEFPTMSLGETLMRPTTMLFRNLMSMDVEESIRANPLDGVVLLAGCDKTTPAQFMGAASVDLPTIMLTGGPKLSGVFRGRLAGSGTAVWEADAEYRAGRMTECDLFEVESCMSRSEGHCNTMGTASTMASMVEALGVQPSGSAAIPAVDSRRYSGAQVAGERIVTMVREGVRLSDIATREAFENAIRTLAAIGGSTNAIVHLLAMAGRLGVPLSLDDFDRLSRDVPLLVNLQPSGTRLMEDFFTAGGLPAVMRELGDLLHTDAMTVTGRTIGEEVADARCDDPDVIRPRDNPVATEGGTLVLRGNLCPGGAVLKQSAASPDLLHHRGRAVVFDSIEEYLATVDSDAVELDEHSVLVVKGAGPRGYPGMPEVGNLPLPKRVLTRGIRDMVRISDARMSGTGYGTVILHVAPEAAVGGPLALVRTGDEIELDAGERRLQLLVDDTELARRRAEWTPPDSRPERGYVRLYVDHVLQADRGVDFDFLVGGSGAAVPRHSH